MTLRVRTPSMSRPPRAALAAASLALPALLAACAPDGAAAPELPQAAVVALAADALVPLASLGDTAVVRPRVVDRTGVPLPGARLRWSLSPDGVVVQEAEGVYRAVGNGRATIVAELDPGETGVRPGGYWAGRLADSVVIEVRQRPARLVLGAVDTAFTTLGAARQLRAQLSDARGNAMLVAPPLVWSSADARVVAVDAGGVVRSAGEGTARITVFAEHLAGTATFSVQPRLPHTSCMVFALRRQTRQSCVTLDLVVREREAGR